MFILFIRYSTHNPEKLFRTMQFKLKTLQLLAFLSISQAATAEIYWHGVGTEDKKIKTLANYVITMQNSAKWILMKGLGPVAR